jgi:hypothetical protein
MVHDLYEMIERFKSYISILFCFPSRLEIPLTLKTATTPWGRRGINSENWY